MTARPAPVVDDRPASLWLRLLASLVDQVLVLVLGGGVVLAAVTSASLDRAAGGPGATGVPGPLLVASAVLVVVVAVAQWLVHGRLGWTVGRRLVGIRTVDVHSRRPIGAVRVLVRGLVVAAGALACLVGQLVVLLSPLMDRTGRRRGWHDRAVDAEVLQTRRDPAGPRARAADRTTGAYLVSSAAAPQDDGPDGRDATGPAVPTPAGPPAAPDSASPPTGGLVLAPLDQERAAPDLDTRAIPAVRTSPTLAFGLAPELEMTRPAPPRTDVVPEPRGRPTAGLRVTLDDGRTLTVERLALVGRNPSPAPGVQVVRVVDPARSVSKTHLQLAVDDTGGAWVVDRGSTNGTLVTLPDGAQVVCPVDHPVRLRPGAVVAFGDRSLRVVATPAGSGRAAVPGRSS